MICRRKQSASRRDAECEVGSFGISEYEASGASDLYFWVGRSSASIQKLQGKFEAEEAAREGCSFPPWMGAWEAS